MELFYQSCEIAATIVETLIILEFISKLLGCRFYGLKRKITFVVSFIVINSYMIFTGIVSPQYSPAADIVVLSLYLVYTLYTTQSSIIYKIITPVLTIFAIMMINISVYLVMTISFGLESGELITEQSSIRLVSLFITKFGLFLFTRIVLKIAKPKTVSIGVKELVAVSLIFLLTVVLSAFFAKMQFASKVENIGAFSLVFFICIMAINIINFILLSTIAKKNQEILYQTMIKTQLKEQCKMYDSVGTVYRNLRILQHDLKNELLCVQNYVEHEENQKAIQYIEKITNTKLSMVHEYVKTGSEILDAMINIKLNYAREHGIEIYCNIGVSLDGYNENDIVMLFSNAIDNAIESSVQQVKKKIVVTMTNRRNYLCITIENAIDTSVLKNNARLSTTKTDKELHGLGTQSMQNMIEQYDGMIDFYERNGMFVVDMMVKREDKDTK